MKKQAIISTLWGFVLLLLAACSNENTNTAVADTEVNVAQKVAFKVDFADYNADEELNGTRAAANKVLGEQNVELPNGLRAEVAIRRDTTRQTSEARTAATRALADDTYTMLAYDAGGVLKAELTGRVSAGVFSVQSGGMRLKVGDTYTLVCYNSKVTRNGSKLVVTQANAGTALVGRTTYTVPATPYYQTVNFTLKHVAARIRIKLVGWMEVPATNATLTTTQAVPAATEYDAITGAATVTGNASVTTQLTFPASTEAQYTADAYTSLSNEYSYFLPTTDVSKLRLTFSGGQIYKTYAMTGARLTLTPKQTLTLDANGSYLITVTLAYNFLYLMSNGDIGTYHDTTFGGGTKTPVGIVVSRGKKIAMALQKAGNNAYVKWYAGSNWNVAYNTVMPNSRSQVIATTNGYEATWNPATNTPAAGTTPKGDNLTMFPSFYYAGHYGEELAAKGIPATGTLAGKKWYLPANGELANLYTMLTLGETIPAIGFSYTMYNAMLTNAMGQVGGVTSFWIWTSVQHLSIFFPGNLSRASDVSFGGNMVSIYGDRATYNEAYIMAFIKY